MSRKKASRQGEAQARASARDTNPQTASDSVELLSVCDVCGIHLDPDQRCPACLLEAALLESSAADSMTGCSLKSEPTPRARIQADFAAVSRAMVQMASSTLPRDFGGFCLRRQIAAGGMGLVFEAHQRIPDRRVALKMMRYGPFATAAELARFQVEVTAVARLNHPNIVPIYEVGEYEGHPYFTMQLFEEGSLADRLFQCPRVGTLPCVGEPGACRVPPHRAAQLIATLARAVHHAHQHGILHRDLKPSNILLDATGEPHLVDFGLAKLEDDSNRKPALTLTASALGTPDYMAPEQAGGRTREITTATDVWGLGAVLYQLLTGRKPFAGEFTAEVIDHVRHKEPLPPSRICREVSRDLEAICLRCLEKKPARRYPGANILAEELDRFLRGDPVLARPVTPTERVVRWGLRNPQFAALGSVTLLLLLLAITGISLQWRRTQSARSIAEESAYFATIANALAAREHHDFGEARRLLASLDPDRRGFEWRLLNGLCRGDERMTTRIPSGSPRSLAWWPEKRRFAVLTDTGRLDLIDPLTGVVESNAFPSLPQIASDAIQRFNPHGALSVAPGGRRVACIVGTTLCVVESASGHVFQRSDLKFSDVAWLDEDRLLLGWNSFDDATENGAAWMVDLRGEKVTELPHDLSAPLAVSPDRQWVALAQYEKQPFAVRVWPADAFPGTPPITLAAPPNEFSHPSFVTISADNQFAAVAWGSWDIGSREVAVYRLVDGQMVFNQSLPFPINALAFSPIEPLLAIASEDAAVRTFRFLEPVPQPNTYDDGEDGGGDAIGSRGPQIPPEKMLTRSAQRGRAGFLLGHEARVCDVTFTSDGQSLISASNDGQLRLWPKQAEAPNARVSGLDTTTYCFQPACSTNGRWVLLHLTDRHVWWWDRKDRRRLDLGKDEAPLAVMADGRALTFSETRGVVTMWRCDADGIHELWKTSGLEIDVCRTGALSPDEQTLVGLSGRQIFALNLTTGELRQTADANMDFGGNSVADHALSLDGRWLAVTALGPRTQIRSAQDLRKIRETLGAPRNYDTAVEFHPDGSRLFVGNEDGFVRVFSTQSWEELPNESFQAQLGAVTALALSRDGAVLATSGDETLKLWDARPAPGTARRRRLELRVNWPRNWIRFADQDQVLLHSAEHQPLEAWIAPR